MEPSHKATIPDTAWKPLYRVGAVAILIAIVIFRRHWGVELEAFAGFGILDVPETLPVNSQAWFALLQQNTYVALCLLDLLDMVNYALVGILFLALYGALRRTNRSAVTIATALALVAMAVHLATNPALAMLSLSNQFAAETNDSLRMFVAIAGEAVLARYQGSGFYVSLFLIYLAGLIASIAMLRSGTFGKAAAYCGILANSIGLTFFITLALAPALSAIPPALSALFRMAWYILTAIRLLRMGTRAAGKASP